MTSAPPAAGGSGGSRRRTFFRAALTASRARLRDCCCSEELREAAKEDAGPGAAWLASPLSAVPHVSADVRGAAVPVVAELAAAAAATLPTTGCPHVAAEGSDALRAPRSSLSDSTMTSSSSIAAARSRERSEPDSRAGAGRGAAAAAAEAGSWPLMVMGGACRPLPSSTLAKRLALSIVRGLAPAFGPPNAADAAGATAVTAPLAAAATADILARFISSSDGLWSGHASTPA